MMPNQIGIQLPPLHSMQTQIASHPARFRIVATGRQVGKSILDAEELEVAMVNHGHACWLVAPDYRRTSYVLNYLLKFTHNVPGITYSKKEMRFECINGGYIQLASADDPMALKGDTLDFVVMDEAAFIKPEAWFESIRPMLTVRRGRALFTSCVVANTRLTTESGLIEIGSLSPMKHPDSKIPLQLKVAGFNGKPNDAEGFYVNGAVPTIKITTSAGYSLEGSENHRVWAMDSEGNPSWVRLDNLTKDQYVAIRRGANLWGENDDLSEFQYSGRKLRRDKIDCNLSEMTCDLAYLMGLILGDGYVDFKRGKVTITHGRDEIETIRFLLSKPMNLDFRRYGDLHTSVSRPKFSQFLSWYGFVEGARAYEKQVPRRLFSASRETIQHFLSGLFDADGCSNKRNGSISFATSSEVMAQQIQLLLLNFGIICRMRKQKSHLNGIEYTDCNTLELSPHDSRLFYDLIGFRLGRKQERKQFLKLTGNRSRNSDGVPHQSQRFIRIRKGSWFKGNVTYGLDSLQKQSLIGYGKLQEVIDRCRETIAVEDLNIFRKLLNDQYFWCPVKTIERSFAETFDLTVPETNAYLANGFITHNTFFGRNWFWELWQYANKGDDPEWKAFKFPTSASPYQTPEEIEAIKRTTPTSVFMQEYMAEPMADNALVFRGVEDIAILSPAEQPLRHHVYVAGLDWGKNQDYSVLHILDVSETPVRMVAKYRFNEVGYIVQREWLKNAIAFWKPSIIIAEKTMNEANIEQLAADGIKGIVPFDMQIGSKQLVIGALQVAIEHKDILLLNDVNLKAELQGYEAEQLPSGKYKFGAPKGMHDDEVIALALAWHGASGQYYADNLIRRVKASGLYERDVKRTYPSWQKKVNVVLPR